MADGRSGPVSKPLTSRGRWTSFIADAEVAKPHQLRDQSNPQHRVRVEHDNHTLLIHLSDEDASGWTTIAVDRATREWAVAQRDTRRAAAAAAYTSLYDISA